MNRSNNLETNSDRSQIIQAIRTPLGFFVLVVLVIEVIFGVIASAAGGLERSYLVISMIVLIFALVVIVAFLAYSRPEALQGARYNPEAEKESKNEKADPLVIELNQRIAKLTREKDALAAKAERNSKELTEKNKALQSELDDYRSLKTLLLGIFASGERLSLDQIHILIHPRGVKKEWSRSDILATLGVLSQEGKVEADRSLPGYYRKTEK
jgi:hypothetical protein